MAIDYNGNGHGVYRISLPDWITFPQQLSELWSWPIKRLEQLAAAGHIVPTIRDGRRMVSTLTFGRNPSRFIQDRATDILVAERKAKRPAAEVKGLSSSSSLVDEIGRSVGAHGSVIDELIRQKEFPGETCGKTGAMGVNRSVFRNWLQADVANQQKVRHLERNRRAKESAQKIKADSETMTREEALEDAREIESARMEKNLRRFAK